MWNKHAYLMVFVFLTVCLLAGCGSNGKGNIANSENDGKGSVSAEQSPVDTNADKDGASDEKQDNFGDSGSMTGVGESIITNAGTKISFDTLEHYSENGSVVYYTKDITPEALVAIYEAPNWEPEGKVGVKISTGEPPASHYLDPNLMKDLVQMVNGTIVECNTAYGGSRAGTAMHYQVAKDHGYTDIADVDILDEEGSMTLSVNGGQRLSENYVGSHFADYGSYIILSHFKGHAMAGFGGAIKNISIGFGSGESGKANIHTGGKGGNMWSADQDSFLEAMADAGKSVSDYMGNGDRIIYINVMNNLSVDCDCDGHAAAPDMHDIGILASTDPVALDQACVDLVLQCPDHESLQKRMEGKNGYHTMEAGEKIGLGKRAYRLIDIDGTGDVHESATGRASGGINTENRENEEMRKQITVSFNGHMYTATMEDHSSAVEFVEWMEENGGSITINASDYGNFEKVGALGTDIVRNDERITTVPGDIILYLGNQITVYYAKNSWNFTRLGRLDGNLSNLESDLGKGDVDITFSLQE